MRRRLALTVAVLASFGLLTTACTTAPGGANSATPAKTAAQVLADAAAASKGQSFTYTIAYGNALTADGAQDESAANSSRNITYTDAASGLVLKANLVLVGSGLYAKVDLGAAALLVPGLAGVGQKWLTLDRSKIGTSGMAAGLMPTADSSGADAYLSGVVAAQTVSPTQIKGTLDLSKATAKVLPATEIANLSATAKIVPFVADLDGQGRISKVVISLPALATLPAADLVVTYAGYGSTVSITQPAAGDTVPAPDLIYSFLQ